MTLISTYKKAVLVLKKSGDQTAELDASILLEYITKKNRGNILSHPEEPLTNSQNAKFANLIKKRINGMPIAYILGHKEFFGYDFYVNKNTLIPRPETEKLVELVLNRIDKENIRILDMGTGSGCIIISLAKELEKKGINCNLQACDISSKALYVAKKNAQRHQVTENIRFFISDLFDNRRLHNKYDIIVANLPYVPTTNRKNKPTIKDSSIHFEPQSAIFVDGDGSNIITRFLEQSKNRLSKNGAIFLELDERNSMKIKEIAKKYFSEKKIELLNDLSGKLRYLTIEKS
jgi:release factor glutamine methyltransferase